MVTAVGAKRGDRKRNVGSFVDLRTDENCWRSRVGCTIWCVATPKYNIPTGWPYGTVNSRYHLVPVPFRHDTPIFVLGVRPRARCVQPVCLRTITILSFTQLYIIINTCVGDTTPTDGRHCDARDNRYCT